MHAVVRPLFRVAPLASALAAALSLGACAAIAPPELPSADPGGLPLPVAAPVRPSGAGSSPPAAAPA